MLAELSDFLRPIYKHSITCESRQRVNSSEMWVRLIDTSPFAFSLFHLAGRWRQFHEQLEEFGLPMWRIDKFPVDYKAEHFAIADARVCEANALISPLLDLQKVYKRGFFKVNEALHSHRSEDVVEAYQTVLRWVRVNNIINSFSIERHPKIKVTLVYELPEIRRAREGLRAGETIFRRLFCAGA
jgi:hypothetical protein